MRVKIAFLGPQRRTETDVVRNKMRNYIADGDAMQCDATRWNERNATYCQTAGRPGRVEIDGRDLT